MHSILMPLYYTTSSSISSCLVSDYSSKKVINPLKGETFTFRCYQCLTWVYLPSPMPIPSPSMGSSVGILLTRIQVASDSAIDTSWFWYASRACPIWQLNISLGLFENHYELKKDRTQAKIFTRISLQIHLSLWVNRCFFLLDTIFNKKLFEHLIKVY